MKILLTADLHSRRDWYDWLLKQAPRYDATAIAGDLLDMFQDPQPQIEFLREWAAKIKLTGTLLFVCDGNHDRNSNALSWSTGHKAAYSPEQAGFSERAQAAEHWMDALVHEGASIVGGMAKAFPELEGLIVTSLLYGPDNEATNATLMERGAQLRRASPLSPWVVLHHQPPVGLLGRPELGNRLFGDWIEEHQPRAVLCGHDHDTPGFSNTCCDRIGLTYVFNSGHNPENDFPAHILLDTETMRYQWQR